MSSEPTAPGSVEPEIRILLVGKTGAGMSSVGNTILGLTQKDPHGFKTGGGANAVTEECELKTGTYKDFDVKVLDTPGLFSEGRDDTLLKEKWLKGIGEISPGPNAIVWVLECKKFEREDVKMLKALENGFKGAHRHIIFMFTNEDKINKEGAGAPETHCNLVIQDNDAKFQIFNNKLTPEESKGQVEELLDTVIEMKKVNKQNVNKECFSNGLLERAIVKFFEHLAKEDKKPLKKSAGENIVDFLINITLDVSEGKLKLEDFIQKLKALASELKKK